VLERSGIAPFVDVDDMRLPTRGCTDVGLKIERVGCADSFASAAATDVGDRQVDEAAESRNTVLYWGVPFKVNFN
jgi:hypothetical protein